MVDKMIHDILTNATIDGNTVKLNCGQVQRDTYEKVDSILKRLWGKWNGRKKAHIFPYDPTDMINTYLEHGKLPPKNETAYFPTPKSMVDDIVTWCKNDPSIFCPNILEPSAGQGAFLDSLKEAYPDSKLTCVEYLEMNADILKSKGYNPIVDDFMNVEFKEKFDLIVMNPPFSLAGDKKAYITHIMKAHSLLSERGVLFAVTPKGWTFNGDSISKDFKKFVSIYGDSVTQYDKGTFKDSGTMIETCVIAFGSKESVDEVRPEYYEEQFFHFVVGNMGYEFSRYQHKNISSEEYFNKVISFSRDQDCLVGGLPEFLDRKKCIEIVDDFDSEQ